MLDTVLTLTTLRTRSSRSVDEHTLQLAQTPFSFDATEVCNYYDRISLCQDMFVSKYCCVKMLKRQNIFAATYWFVKIPLYHNIIA